MQLYLDHNHDNLFTKMIATVCSIKDEVTGHLRLTEAGMAEIGDCSLNNFHPHSTEPPLWAEADHVKTEVDSRIILKDLRYR